MPETVPTGDRLPGPAVDPACLELRRAHFDRRIVFHAPGLRRYSTPDYGGHDAVEFASVSVTGNACALGCEHCKMKVLKGMLDLRRSPRSLFETCARLKERGARGVLISGGSDRNGRVPLARHLADLVRVRRELGLVIRVHPGLPDEETCAGLAAAEIDGAMVDIIGDDRTIRDVYHLDTDVGEYEAVLERLERHGVPTVPHIVVGLHFGQMLGEWHALEMIARHPPKILVVVILMPLTGTPMASCKPPSLDDIGAFFETARKRLPSVPVMLGCARPLGPIKQHIDRLAVDAGFNGIAYPSDGMVGYAREQGLEPDFINACCGVQW